MERKGERARCEPLGDRTETDAVPEPLLHVGLQVDAREVPRRLDASVRERRDDRLPVDIPGERHDVDEPRTLVVGIVGTRKLEPWHVRKDLSIATRRRATA